MHIIAVCLLNLHEDERMKPKNWVPVGWLPVYNESRDLRRKTGFDFTSARKVRLYHACWIEFLDRWAECTRDAMNIPWADGKNRWTRLFIGGVMGDQQEGDRYTGEPCVCHRTLERLLWQSNGARSHMEHVNGVHDCLRQFRPLFGY
jgi:hypothetical protein